MNGMDGMDGMNGNDGRYGVGGTDGTTRDLRSLLEGIVDEEGRAAEPAAGDADVELALLTSRVRRHRAVRGAVTTVSAVAAAGVIGVVAIQGILPMPDAPPAVGPAPSVTDLPSPPEPVPSPSVAAPTPTSEPQPATEPSPDPPPPQVTEPVAPPVTEAPPAPTTPETIARAVFAEYFDAWLSGDTATLVSLTQPGFGDVYTPDYTVNGEPRCDYLADVQVLECDVPVAEGEVGPAYFMAQVSVGADADGHWWAQTGVFDFE